MKYLCLMLLCAAPAYADDIHAGYNAGYATVGLPPADASFMYKEGFDQGQDDQRYEEQSLDARKAADDKQFEDPFGLQPTGKDVSPKL